MSNRQRRRRIDKLEELSTTKLVALLIFVSGVSLWAPWSIYRGITTGRILVPLCHWDCMASIQNPSSFAGAIALWLFSFVLTTLCAIGLALALWQRVKR
jgi:hypothetical protein